MEEINEPITVYAFFGRGKITPIAFGWRGRRYEKLKVVSSWATQNTPGRLHRWFALSDGANTYRIKFDANGVDWRLITVHQN